MTERNVHAVYVISVFAELAGVHPQTLRNYERSGLLHPERTSGGSRRFSEEDLAALRRIQDLTNEGVNLEGVKRIMALESRLDELRIELQGLSDEARRKLEQTHRHYRRDLVPVSNSLAVVFDAGKRKAR
ncbi:MAG: heat shock protein transcriptional repressor HspR [Acidimicrobiales bacterium]